MFGRKEVCSTAIATKAGNVFADMKEQINAGVEEIEAIMAKREGVKAEHEAVIKRIDEDLEKDRVNLVALKAKSTKLNELV